MENYLVPLLTHLSLMPSSSEQMRNCLIIVQVVVVFLMVSKLSAGLGLYWAASSLVGLFQTLRLRYRPDESK